MTALAVVGATTWGTTLALIAARRGVPVRLLTRTPEEADRLHADREHKQFLPGHPFPQSLTLTHDPEKAFHGAAVVVFGVPSRSLRENAMKVRDHIRGTPAVVSATKGLEPGSGLRMTEVLTDVLPERLHDTVCALSGPNLAGEIARGLPASTVVASRNPRAAEIARDALMSHRFRVYTNDDVIGVELGGALKNIIALGAGVCDGVGFGDNSKAGLITRGLAEITRLGVAAGANPLTFAGLAGLGDLVATCASHLSRNHQVGERLGRGEPWGDIQATLGHVAEGVYTTPAALRLADSLHVEMPIAQVTYRVLFEGLSVPDAVEELMGRPPRQEWTGVPRPS